MPKSHTIPEINFMIEAMERLREIDVNEDSIALDNWFKKYVFNEILDLWQRIRELEKENARLIKYQAKANQHALDMIDEKTEFRNRIIELEMINKKLNDELSARRGIHHPTKTLQCQVLDKLIFLAKSQGSVSLIWIGNYELHYGETIIRGIPENQINQRILNCKSI